MTLTMLRCLILYVILSFLSCTSLIAADSGIAFMGELYSGSIEDDSTESVYAAVTIPILSQFGFHVETLADKLDDDDSRNIGGHLYWRNPDYGLFGVIASHSEFDIEGFDYDLDGVGAELEIYLEPVVFAAQYATLDSDDLEFEDEEYLAFDAHLYEGGAIYLALGYRSLLEEDISYAELSINADRGVSPFSVYLGGTWNDFESRYLGVDYVFYQTNKADLSLFLEGDWLEDDIDAYFLGVAYNFGPVDDAPLMSLFDNLKGGF